MTHALQATQDGRTARLPTVQEFGHRLDAMPPCWLPYGPPDQGDPSQVMLPARVTLEVMEREMLLALQPAGMQAAAKATVALIASFPARDSSTGAYAEAVTKRLAECPADLLAEVVDAIIDDAGDFRPSPGRVKQGVDRLVSKRKLLLMRIQSAIRWHDWDAEQRRRAEAVLKDREAAAARSVMGAPVSLRFPTLPVGSMLPEDPTPKRAVKAAPIKPEHLKALREKRAR
jgi:hypothetical protein